MTLNIPQRASLAGIVDGRMLVTLDEPWDAGQGTRFATDSIVSYDLAEWERDPLTARPTLVWAPGPRQTLNGIMTTRGKLIVNVLDNVRGRAFALDYADGRWRTSEIALPRNATIGLAAASDQDEQAMFTVTDYLTPQTLYHYDGASGRLETLKTTPARFDASHHVVEQLEAVSRDGTRIPYFLIRPRTMRYDGSTPTILYGYGGFQSSARCPIIRGRWAGSGWSRAMPGSSPICAAAASSGRNGTRAPSSPTSSGPGTIISRSPRI